jgi:hypothetical protein
MTEDQVRTWTPAVIVVLISIIIIVICFVPGKEGPQGSKGLPGQTGPSGYSEAEMGPMGDMGPTGPTGSSGVIGYNKWNVIELQMGANYSTTVPYKGLTRFVNYYWGSNSKDNLYLYIDATQYKVGDIFTITNLNNVHNDVSKNPKIYIRPQGFQNMNTDSSDNYWLQGGKTCLNTILIIITQGNNCVEPFASGNNLLINISYSMILSDNLFGYGKWV